MNDRQLFKIYEKVIVFFQPILYVIYIWFSFNNFMSSVSLREYQKNIYPEKTPFGYLADGLIGFSITVLLMIFLTIITVKKKIKITPFFFANLFIPCAAILLRLYPFLIFLSLNGELLLWKYICVNETVFFLMNILFIAITIKCHSLKNFKTQKITVSIIQTPVTIYLFMFGLFL